MPTVCFVPGCKTGYTSERRKCGPKISLFQAPKDPDVFEVWQKSIPRADRKLRYGDTICAKHFKQDDIERFFETKLFDGTVFRIPRSRIMLKPGAIPCIFPDIPGHSTYAPEEVRSPKIRKKKLKKTGLTKTAPPNQKQKSGKLKTSLLEKKDSSVQLGKENILFEGIVLHPIPQNPPTLLKEREDDGNEMSSTPLQNCSINESESSSTVDELEKEYSAVDELEKEYSAVDELEKEYSTPNLYEDMLSESNVIVPKSVVEEQFSFNFLKINVNMIDTLNSWWKVNVLDDFISFIRWKPNYRVERKIVITKDLAVKVFLKDKETAIGHDLKVLSIDVISKLIFRVERTQICRGIHIKERSCDGFLQGVFQCKKHNLCLGCIQWEREQKKLLIKAEKLQMKAEKLQMKSEKHSSNLVELIRFNVNEQLT